MVNRLVLSVGAFSGIAWWAASVALGAYAYGVLGTHRTTGIVAGAITGILVTILSLPVYRRLSLRSLLWYSPVSVYLAIAIYGLFVFLNRSFAGDFLPGQRPVAVGIQSVVGMWWGITIIAPIGVTVHILAYGNHRLLRALFSSVTPTPAESDPGDTTGTESWRSTT